jgi:uncharacterized protein YjbI with pentapeptide repeats
VKRMSLAPFFCLVFAALCFGSGAVHGFRQGDVEKLLATNNCQWCDLRGVELSGGQLSGADMSGANLSDAQLSGADLSGANLSTAYLKKANLSGANLSGAYFSKSNLTGANLTGANVAGADFSGATWIDATKCEQRSVGKCAQSIVIGPRDEKPALFPFDF